jgi:hypothetical protein
MTVFAAVVASLHSGTQPMMVAASRKPWKGQGPGSTIHYALGPAFPPPPPLVPSPSTRLPTNQPSREHARNFCEAKTIIIIAYACIYYLRQCINSSNTCLLKISAMVRVLSVFVAILLLSQVFYVCAKRKSKKQSKKTEQPVEDAAKEFLLKPQPDEEAKKQHKPICCC